MASVVLNPSPANDLPELSDIAEAVKKQQCNLFLGAAIHCAPPDGSGFVYPDEARPASASALSRHLAERSGLLLRRSNENPENLQRVALDFQIEKGRGRLVDEVRSKVQDGKSPSPLLRGLAELGFRMIVTTNYDTLTEDALRAAGRRPQVSSYRSNAKERARDYTASDVPTFNSPFLLKVHGDILEDGSSIVITEEDYIQFVFRMASKQSYYPIPDTASFCLAKWPVLFLGYSLLDYNLRLFFKTLRWNLDESTLKQMYSVDFYPDPLIRRVLEDNPNQVKYIVEDVWKFVPALYKEVLGKEMPR